MSDRNYFPIEVLRAAVFPLCILGHRHFHGPRGAANTSDLWQPNYGDPGLTRQTVRLPRVILTNGIG